MAHWVAPLLEGPKGSLKVVLRSENTVCSVAEPCVAIYYTITQLLINSKLLKYIVIYADPVYLQVRAFSEPTFIFSRDLF